MGYDFFEGGLYILQVLVIHVGTPVDHYRVLAVLVHIDEGHAGGFILQNPPMQLNFCLLHLIFDAMHGVIVAHLTNKPTLPSQFTRSHRLVGPLTPIGSEVFERLDGFTLRGDLLDVEEVVGVCTPEDTDFFGLLHKIFPINYYNNVQIRTYLKYRVAVVFR